MVPGRAGRRGVGAAVSAVAAPSGVLGPGSPAAARGRPGVLGGSRGRRRGGGPAPRSRRRPGRSRAGAAPVAARAAGRHVVGRARPHPRGAPPGAAGRHPGIRVARPPRARGLRRRLHRAAGGRDGRGGTHDGRGGLDADRLGPARAETVPGHGTRGLRFARMAPHRPIRGARRARVEAFALRGRRRCPGERRGRKCRRRVRPASRPERRSGGPSRRVDLDRHRASARRDRRRRASDVPSDPPPPGPRSPGPGPDVRDGFRMGVLLRRFSAFRERRPISRPLFRLSHLRPRPEPHRGSLGPSASSRHRRGPGVLPRADSPTARSAT